MKILAGVLGFLVFYTLLALALEFLERQWQLPIAMLLGYWAMSCITSALRAFDSTYKWQWPLRGRNQ